ncbi:ATP-binding protein [Catenulispora pinisilvae]|uniref:ATP-binding protein n=1 Tax=Catenulispora pinisilvae TaxID=2705253 RepID=UPI0018913DD5|nr:ATP-binding protein [Catenulispora pinisilvae]
MATALLEAPRPLFVDFAVPTKRAESVPLSRRIARTTLSLWGIDLKHAVIDDTIVVLSELVTNAHRHASCSGDAEVRIDLTAESLLRIAVHDHHPDKPKALAAPYDDDSGGWGLFVVKQLVERSGGTIVIPLDENGHGKTICVEIPLVAEAFLTSSTTGSVEALAVR